MDLTPEEKEAVRALLAKIREIGEDFTEEYFSRMMLQARGDRVAYLAGKDRSELLLWSLADAVALLDYPEKYAEALVTLEEMNKKGFLNEPYNARVECFYQTARRCLGDAFTPLAQSGHSKLALITRAAVTTGELHTMAPKRANQT